MTKKAIIFFFLSLSIFISGCSNSNSLPKIEKEIENEIKADITIPRSEDLPITFIGLGVPAKVNDEIVYGHYTVHVDYAKEKENKVPQPLFKEVKDGHPPKTLYGPYNGEKIIELVISKGEGKGSSYITLEKFVEKQIGKMTVKVEELNSKDGKVMFLLFDINDVFYMMRFRLSDTFNEQDAFEFASNLISEINN